MAPNDVGNGDEMRPDGRAVTPESRILRMSTRALRSHLDKLPIDYDLDVSGDRFLADLAFTFARQRYDCTDSMIGAGFGGTVLGAIARSLFIDGLRWLWMSEQPEHRRCLLGELLAERNHICILLEETGATCPILPRWFMPLPDVADLTGQSLTWLHSPCMPSDEDLLQNFLTQCAADPSSDAGTEHLVSLQRGRRLQEMAGLRGAVMVLAHAGHGNYLGLQSSLTDDGAPGHDLRADHEALFMQIAAAGVVCTLLGTAAVVPESWPADVERGPFLERAVDLAADVTISAVPIHRLDAARPSYTAIERRRCRVRNGPVLRPRAILAADDLLPDVNSVEGVTNACEAYYELARSYMVRAWDYGQPSLHSMLAYAGGHSNLQTVMSTYGQPGSEVICVFAARMLLEEAARLIWRFSVSDEAAFKARAKQYFDEYRARQKKTVDTLVSHGVAKANAQAIFARPHTVRIDTPLHEIAKGRKGLPSISSMLRDMGAPFPEPGWLDVAYSLLSQITHSTPMGHLHTERFHDGLMHGGELSPEMLGLALDTACLGSAHLIGLSAVILTDQSRDATKYYDDLWRAATEVHDAARLVHGLD